MRRFSLREELPGVFQRLITSPPGTEVAFTLDERYFSLFIAGRTLEARTASISIVTPLTNFGAAKIALAVKPAPPPVPPKTAAYIEATALEKPRWVNGGLQEFDCGSVLQTPPANAGLKTGIVGTYLLKVATVGTLGTANAIDPAAVRDIALLVGYRLATPDPQVAAPVADHSHG